MEIGKRSRCVCHIVLVGALAMMAVLGWGFQVQGTDAAFEVAANFALWELVLCNLLLLLYIFRQVRQRVVLLLFQVCYNLLLLGRVYVSWATDYAHVKKLLEADSFSSIFLSLQILALGLLAIFAAYRVSGAFFRRREQRLQKQGACKTRDNPLVPIIRQLSFVMLCLSSVAFFYSLFRNILFVLHNGYLASYTEQNPMQVPALISRVASLFVPSFAVFLGTLPTRKQLYFPLFLYGVYMFSSILTGRRNIIVCELLMLLVYFLLRDNLRAKGRRYLTPRVVVPALLCGVGAAYLLQMFAYARIDAAETGSFGQVLLRFVDSQGASFRVVNETVEHMASFDPAVAYQYLLYPLELFFRNNAFTGTLFGLVPVPAETQTVGYVQSTHNFGHVLTYLVSPEKYLRGEGFGTSFIAEGYVAAGFLGVLLVGIMAGVALRFIASLLSHSWVGIALGLIALRGLVYIPRNFTLHWLTETFTITYLCLFAAFYFVALLALHLGTHLRHVRELDRRPVEVEV